MSLSIKQINQLLFGLVAAIGFLSIILFVLFLCYHLIATTASPQQAVTAVQGLLPVGGGAFAVLLTACTGVMTMLIRAEGHQ